MRKLYFLIFLLISFSACQEEREVLPEPSSGSVDGTEQEEFPVIQGHVRVKLKEDAVERLKVVATRSGVTTAIENLDLANTNLKVYRMERVFPDAGKFEARHRAAGLHLWYDVYFDTQVPTRSAVSEYGNLPEVEFVEQIREAKLIGAEPIPFWIEPLLNLEVMHRTARLLAAGDEAEKMPFNDPRLPEQWHYHNTGELSNGLVGAIEGADVNAFKAWEIETGSPKVIVAVMDGGIKTDHPDLAANMWVNEAELNGTPGVDDDNNGYVDDIYGWNYVDKSGTIVQHTHGTHCAGTIGAVNNNGTGVCGIAGGSGKGDGIRLMSCQMFKTNPETGKDQGYTDPKMFVYAADMGATISSNSWTSGPDETGTNFLNGAIRAAIDYFIDNAGMDLNGKQTGPMKGGLVIFAAANRNSDIPDWPAAYERNFRVASMGANFKKASYSNYGTWVDITAPGGEQSNGDKYAILSTEINDGYSWKQGTSMACPHATGCAALVLSKFQAEGYTPDELKERLMNSAGNIDQYNPKYEGLMGVGYIDVGTALTPPSTEAPDTTELHLIDSYDNWAIFEWTVGVAGDGPLSKYELYWSTSPITDVDAPEVSKKIKDVKFLPEGTLIREIISGLRTDVRYYYRLRAFDRWGSFSELSAEKSAVTVKNQAPQLTAGWSGQILLDEGSSRRLTIGCIEPENQTIATAIHPALSWVNIEYAEGNLNLDIHAGYGVAGNYSLTLTVMDQYGASSTLQIPFEVVRKATAPIITNPIQNQEIAVSAREMEFSLSDHFADPGKATLVYNLENTDNTVAIAQRKGDKLVITPRKVGTTYVTVRAVNPDNLSVSCRFAVYVKGESMDGEDWSANLQNNVVNIRLGKDLQGKAVIRLYNMSGRQVIAQEVAIGAEGYDMSLSGVSSGVYLLTITTANGQELKQTITKK